MNKKFVSCVCVVLGALVGYAGSSLRVSELHWNPASEVVDGVEVESDDLEFIELRNCGTQPIALGGASVVKGVVHTFVGGLVLEPGQYYVIAKNADVFQKRYGMLPQAVFMGKLSNKGEQILIVSALGDTLVDVTYNNTMDWPQLSDGAGFSMVSVDDTLNQSKARAWRNSSLLGGSPGKADVLVSHLPVYINEVIANTIAPRADAIELYNPNTVAVDVSGWYLADKVDSDKKFKIPARTVVSAGGYITFVASTFSGSTPLFDSSNFGLSFGLSSNGDKVFLMSARGDTLTGFIDGHEFGASDAGQSVGRVTTSDSKAYFVAQVANTLGKQNAPAKTGPVVIDELLYNPIGRCEYVKLRNISGAPVEMSDGKGNGWDVGGIGFENDSLVGVVLQPGASLYIIEDSVSKQLFRTMNNIPPQTQVLSFSGALDNSGETIELTRPGTPYFDENNLVVVPSISVDVVDYQPASPWPAGASSRGMYLKRLRDSVFGSEPTNWEARGFALPVANAGKDATAYVDSLVMVDGSLSSDVGGLPLSYAWKIVSKPEGSKLVLADSAAKTFAMKPDVRGTYLLSLTVSNGEQSSMPDQLSIVVKDQTASVNVPVVVVARRKANVSVYPSITRDRVFIESKVAYTRVDVVDWAGTTLSFDEPLKTLDLGRFVAGGRWVVVLVYDGETLVHQAKIFLW